MGLVEPRVTDFLEQIRRENDAIQIEPTKSISIRNEAERGEEVREGLFDPYSDEEEEGKEKETDPVARWET